MDEKPANHPSYVALAAWATAAGAAVWVLSPLITHTAEPWDSGYVYWFGLVLISAGLAWYSRRRSALAPILIGLWLGQFLYGFVWLGFGNLWPLGLIALAVYLIPAWIAALIVYWWIGRAHARG